jgi:hypothetical protein
MSTQSSVGGGGSSSAMVEEPQCLLLGRRYGQAQSRDGAHCASHGGLREPLCLVPPAAPGQDQGVVCIAHHMSVPGDMGHRRTESYAVIHRMGPNTDPCGTPQSTGLFFSPFLPVYAIHRSLRYERMRRTRYAVP